MLRRGRIDRRRRHDIARQRRTRIRSRIVHDRPRQQRREVSRSERGDRNGAQERLRLAHAFAFVIGEEEQPVLAVEKLRHLNGTAHIEAELVQLEWRDRIFGGIEEVLRIQRRVAQELI